MQLFPTETGQVPVPCPLSPVPRTIASIQGFRTNGVYDPVFNSAEQKQNVFEIQIPISDLKVYSSNYKLLLESVESLKDTVITRPSYFSKIKGKGTMPYIPVRFIAHAFIKNAKLHVVLLVKEFMEVFSLDNGYVKFNSKLLLATRKSYTLRLYCLLSRYGFAGKKTMTYDELVNFFGFTEAYGADTNYDSYSKWSVVKKRVIQVALDELKDLWERGISPFYLEFTETRNHALRGNPESVTFTIKKS